MARDKTIKFLRTTRTNLDTQKAAGNLLAGEPYLIIDEDRLAVGTAENDYSETAKKSEVDAKKTDNVSATSSVLGRKSSGAGAIEELTLSEVMDFIGSAAAGDILYRGASAWARLPKGTDGQVLTLASGLPSWANAAGGGAAMNWLRKGTDFTTDSATLDPVSNFSINLTAGKKYRVDIDIVLIKGGEAETSRINLETPSDAKISGSFANKYLYSGAMYDSFPRLNYIDGGSDAIDSRTLPVNSNFYIRGWVFVEVTAAGTLSFSIACNAGTLNFSALSLMAWMEVE